MASNIKTLKEDNGDIVYPQTLTGAVYTSSNTSLDTELAKYVTAEDIATSVSSFGTVTTGMLADDAITTAKIDDGAVTLGKIDYTTMPFYASSSSTSYTVDPSVDTVSVTVAQAGDYYILGIGSAFSGTAGTYLEASIVQGNTVIGKNYSTVSSDRSNTVVGVVASGVPANTTFTLRLTFGSGSGNTNQRTQSIFAARIN